MDKVVAVVFNDEKQAYKDCERSRPAHRWQHHVVFGCRRRQGPERKGPVRKAVRSGRHVLRSAHRKPRRPPRRATWRGGRVSTGTMIGATFDLARANISDDFLQEMSEYLLPGKTAVITEVDEDWQARIDTRIEALGGHVFRRIGSRSKTPTLIGRSTRPATSSSRWRRDRRNLGGAEGQARSENRGRAARSPGKTG